MNYEIHNRDIRPRDFINTRIKSNDSPGIQYMVLSPKSTVFTYNGGWADVIAGRPMQPSTTMMVYSMTKTFTAAAVLQLVEQGIIALDEPVIKYVGDIPYGNQVTIRHLLSQTSGIPNPMPLRWVHLVEEHAMFDEYAAFLKIVAGNAKLDFAPGKKCGYSNISYWLLGLVIEKASASNYEDYVRHNIFLRLNISPSEIDFVIPSGQNHSKGYLPKWSFLNLFKSFVIDSRFIGGYENGWLHIKDHYLNGASFGGIVGSARSIGVFLQDQMHDYSLLFTQETKNLFFQQQRNNDGEPIEMTLGWHLGIAGGVKYYFKEGGGGGFHSEMRIYPSHRLASVVLSNNTSFDTKSFLNEVDGEFIK